MKKHVFISVLALCALPFIIQAQQEAPLGKFIIGTSPLSYAMGSQTSANQSAVFNNNEFYAQTDSAHTTNTTLKAHINIFAGYFVTKNICAGLQFGSGSTDTYSTFIRYYICHRNPDSAKFDFFFQVNGTVSFNNTDHPAITNYYPGGVGTESNSTTDYQTSQNSWGMGLGFAAAYHLTRHWSLELEAGFTYSNSVQITGSYTATTLYYGSGGDVYVYPPLKSKSYSDKGVLKFMLSYRI